MVGLPPDKGDVLIVQFLEDKRIELEEGKIICTDLEELDKTVHFFKKKTAMAKKREANKQ